MRVSPTYWLFLLLIGSAYGQSTSKPSALDTVAAHAVYLDGDFEKATQILESALKRKDLGHGDSVFIFKHLGVIYAAREETRERGKYYMYKLVAAEPLSNILDMYASDMIYMIFKNVKDEFDAGRARMERAQHFLGKDGKGQGLDTAASARSGETDRNGPAALKAKNHNAYYWFGGAGLTAAMVGVGYLVYMQTEEKPAPVKKIYGLE